MPELSFCTVCASNNNRSMQAHLVLENAGFKVRSYGTGSAVRLPGVSIDKPNVFPFTTPYKKILDVIETQMKESGDPRLHRSSGVLDMTLRNVKLKECPERWPYYNQPPQRLDHYDGFKDELDFDVAICCEERCFDLVTEDFLNRNYWDHENVFKKCHVFNVDIRDDHENAQIGGRAILDLAQGLEKLVEETPMDQCWEDAIPSLIASWQVKYPNLPILYALCYH